MSLGLSAWQLAVQESRGRRIEWRLCVLCMCIVCKGGTYVGRGTVGRVMVNLVALTAFFFLLLLIASYFLRMYVYICK